MKHLVIAIEDGCYKGKSLAKGKTYTATNDSGSYLSDHDAAILVQTGQVVSVPTFLTPNATANISVKALEHLLVRAGVLPEPFECSIQGHPFLSAVREAV